MPRRTPRPALPDFAAVWGLALALACGRGSAPPPVAPEPAGVSHAASESRPVTLLYPGGEEGLLQPCEARLPLTGESSDDYAMLIGRYFAGPPCSGQVSAFPEGAGLRAVYLLGEGLLVVDLTGQAATGAGGEVETMRVYGLVDTLRLNFPEIGSVRILVEGREVETLLGHLDLQRPIPPEPSFAAPEVRGRLGMQPQ